MCEALLEEPNVESAVRITDVYGFLVDRYCQQGHFKMASQKLEELRKCVITGSAVLHQPSQPKGPTETHQSNVGAQP